jgi:LytS/YehU family sensor histidine kinase
VLTCTPNHLQLSTRNHIFNEGRQASEKIGLENTQRRLSVLYPEKHRLVYTTTDQVFEVSLDLELL